MKSIYASPIRVYLAFSLLALAGIYAVITLPVSLFPNSSKPLIGIRIQYQNHTPQTFFETFGRDIETQLNNIKENGLEVVNLEATYKSQRVSYDVEFQWGNDGTQAKREVEQLIKTFSSRFSDFSRKNMYVYQNVSNTGFFAVSFYSNSRSLDELYQIIEPALMPKVSEVRDTASPALFNPSEREIRIELIPEMAASLKVYPNHIINAIRHALGSYGSGSLVQGDHSIAIQMPANVHSIDQLKNVLVATPSGTKIPLSKICQITLSEKTKFTRMFKTSGIPSLILFAAPKPDGNIKRMSDDLLSTVQTVLKNLPDDVTYKVLVNPSTFIQSAIQNVFAEVAIGALLAVLVLFFFIGNLRNTVTAAIEIPLSLILAFILMRLSGMQLNLISLGGLALSVGMNVDASVVVMENIFRHLETVKSKLNFTDRLHLISKAVTEVRFPIIVSTIASVVVFLPLAFTSELTYAILGDLAKTVIFSHGLSAIVALILVPTIRLQLMRNGFSSHKDAPLHSLFTRLETAYSKTLSAFLNSRKIRIFTYGMLCASMVGLCTLVLPQLPKEVVGKPNTDWLILGVNTQGNRSIKQMEAKTSEVEFDLLEHFGNDVKYTFTQIGAANRSHIMVRLKDKKRMTLVKKQLEEHYANTPFINYFVSDWNPSKLPIPDPPDFQVVVKHRKNETARKVAKRIRDELQRKDIFPRLEVKPNVKTAYKIDLIPHEDQFTYVKQHISPKDLSDLLLVATDGKHIGQMSVHGKQTDLVLHFPEHWVKSIEDISALPVGLSDKLIPLKALVKIKKEEAYSSFYRKNTYDLFQISGRLHDHQKNNIKKAVSEAKTILGNISDSYGDAKDITRPVIYQDDPEKDLTTALQQLGFALALSILLIFVVLVLQFGNFSSPLFILVSVPLGLMGVLVSLFVFGSSLSLNSVLGMILLNGISVANSILLVVFLNNLVQKGVPPKIAAIEASKRRLRPILMTSLTTILGMMPIALGLGEGGNVLQPLGIAVSGGLWISMILTLFIVPALQVSYLESRFKKTASETNIRLNNPTVRKPHAQLNNQTQRLDV